MSIINAIKRFAGLLRALLPSPVPYGRTDFDTWSASIISLYDFPDNDSIRFALATMIMHLDATGAYRSKWTFAKMIKAGAAKQVASSVFQEIKVKQQAAEAAAKLAAAPAPAAVAVNGSTQ